MLVCDGFAGNILLKGIEGAAAFIMGELREVLTAGVSSKLAAAMVRPGLRELKHRLDYKEVGGAPFLGVARPVIKAHGSSDARAFERALVQAASFAESGFIGKVSEHIEYMTVAASKD